MSKVTTDSTVVVRPARNIEGALRLPGDKSISHRYAMLAAIAEGTTRLENFSTGADCASTLGCLTALGVKVERKDNAVLVHGRGPKLQAATAPLDCGNSGSTMRMLSGLLAAQEGRFTLVGDDSLSRRPMERIRKPLEAMGARLTLTDGHAPLHLEGGALKTRNPPSSQSVCRRHESLPPRRSRGVTGPAADVLDRGRSSPGSAALL